MPCYYNLSIKTHEYKGLPLQEYHSFKITFFNCKIKKLSTGKN